MAKKQSKYLPGKHPNSLETLEKGRRSWQPGKSGNPNGRPKEIKYISEALREQLSDVNLVNELAKELIKRAKKSDNSINIILDRTEGKVTQPITPDGPIIFKVIYERVWDKDKTPGTTPGTD